MRRVACKAIACVALAVLGLGSASCLSSTGGSRFAFDAFVGGPEGASDGEYTFENDRGFEVTLTTARLHVGAIYLNESLPTSVASDTSCALAGIYVAEVHAGIDVDVLDPALVELPQQGASTNDHAQTAEVWLSSGDIDAPSDPTIVAFVEGTATRGGDAYPFRGSITIGSNRVVVPTDPALPGAKPICKQRVVTPIRVDLTPQDGGSLVMRIDPAGWFGNVDFSKLEQTDDDPVLYEFRDDDGDAPSRNLYAGIRANAGVYAIQWHEGADTSD